VLTWFKILYSAKCSYCGMPKRKGAWGSGFCERCEAALPDPLALHLRRAISNRWFMQWWRFAMRLQRTANEKLESH